jgi:predicted permease
MGWLAEMWRRLQFLAQRRGFERDLEEEMQFHLDRKAEAMDLSAARRQFGNVTWLREESREMWGWGGLERLAQDVKYAARTLRKNRGFTLVALLTLAMGIGANTAIYTVVRAVLLAPLPYHEPERLVTLTGVKAYRMSMPDLEDLSAQCPSLEGVAVVGYTVSDTIAQGEPEYLIGKKVSSNLFSLLGVSPAIGRTFEPNESGVIVISDRLWQRRFGGNRAAIGQSIALGPDSRTIIGVMPARFQDGATEYWIPLRRDRNSTNREARMFSSIGRLKRGATLGQARTEVKSVMARLQQAYPATNAHADANITALTDSIVGRVRSILWVLFGAVSVVLLVACANVANLVLSRGAQRKQEMAVRTALGAGRGRLMRLLLTESLLLAVLGGVLGVLLARWGLWAITPLYPPELPRVPEIQLSPAVLWFTLLTSLATAVLTGLLPALRVSRTSLGLRRRDTRTGRLRKMLTVAQVAMAMVLLTCAGLLLRSFLIRTHIAGFNPDPVLVAELSSAAQLPPGRLEEILARLRTAPGITAAAAATSFSYARMMGMPIEVVGQAVAGTRIKPVFEVVTPEYFQVLNIPLRRGRGFAGSDVASSTAAAVISVAMAQRAFGDVEPIGKHLRVGKRDFAIVGVVGDVPMFGADPEPMLYLPETQMAGFEPRNIAVRTAGRPEKAIATVRGVIRAMEPRVPILRLESMHDDMAGMMAEERFYTLLLGIFASLALGLAALGVYGVVSFAVSLRTHEIGVRMALGASAGAVLRSVLREGAAMAVVGTVIGAAGSVAAARLLLSTSLLFRVKPGDPMTMACVPVVLMVSALAASCVPARRAARVDPSVALRWE